MHPKNQTPFKSLDAVAADPRVERIWYEGRENGIWAEMHPGWKDHNTDCHCVHEWTVTDFIFAFKKWVDRCDCEDCIDDKERIMEGTVTRREGAYWVVIGPELPNGMLHLTPKEIAGVPYEGMRVSVRYVSSPTIGHYIAEEVK